MCVAAGRTRRVDQRQPSVHDAAAIETDAQKRHSTPGLARGAAGIEPTAAGLPRRNLGQPQHGPPLRSRSPRPALPILRAARPLADHDLPCGHPARRHLRALRLRRTDRWRKLPGLGHAVPRANPQTRRHRHHGQSVVSQGRWHSPGNRSRRRYLPPYSPDLNPIEQVFAKLEAVLRKAAARTYEALFDAFTDAITRFKEAEFQNYFTAAGYLR